jgi:hypothetical protein
MKIMKTFDLGELNLVELSKNELKETEGGLIWFLVFAVMAVSCGPCSNRLIPKKSEEVACE